MASQHTLLHGLLAAALVAAAGLCSPNVQARSTGLHDGDGISRTLPPLRGDQPRGSDFTDNFDSYAVGSNVHGQNGWKGWANDPNAGAFVDDAFSSSPSNSLNVTGPSDVIHEFDQASGAWVVNAMQYIPSGFTGQSYFIMQNVYNDAGTNLNWSVQVQFDGATGNLINDGGASGGSMPFVTDQWVPIRVEIDLDADTQSFYYNDQLLYSGTWTEEVSGGGTLEIGAIDLFAFGASPIYYDDISITAAAGAPYAVALTADPTAGQGAPGATVTYTVTVENTGTQDDTYDLAAAGAWTASTSVPTIAVTAGTSATFDLTVDVPPGATAGDSDITTVTATSQGDAMVSATVDVTTTAQALPDEIFADGFDGEVVPVCEPLQLLLDTSFEASLTGTGPWTSTSTNFGTGMCDAASCGTGGGTAGPHSGSVWAWLGGTASAETTTASQTVTIPAGSERHLNYWLWVGAVGGVGASMAINVDGSPVTTVTEPASAEAGYTQRTVDLSAFADGGSHTIEFRYTTPAGTVASNFNLDDVTLECEAAPAQQPMPRAVPAGTSAHRIH